MRQTVMRLAALFALIAGPGLPASADTRPVVVELFTSQGCSSCPPADALLGELARRPDVLALGFHINYWDGLGWKDPLSSEAATERQRRYARRRPGGRVYTPQIVIDGADEFVGSDRGAILGAIREPRPDTAAPVRFAADGRSVEIGAGAGKGEVLLVRFARHRTTHVDGGENARRVLEDANGVERITALGEWRGAALTLAIDPPGAGEGVAVLVQGADGRIFAAASALAPDPSASQ